MDAVLLNGHAVAYEIKSERDTLDRLPTQIDAYRQVFSEVNVLTNEKYATDVVTSVPMDVGVLVLTRMGSIRTIQPPTTDVSRIQSTIVFDSLRRPEALAILAMYGIPVPERPNTQMHAALRAEFARLNPAQAHDGMVAILKRSRGLQSREEILRRLPKSLNAAILTGRFSNDERERIAAAMLVPLDRALNWA